MTFTVDPDLLAVVKGDEVLAWLSPSLYRMFVMLNAADGKWVPKSELMAPLQDERRARGARNVTSERNVLKVQICHLRKRIAGFAVLEAGGTGAGYRLLPLPEVSTS
jgi:hypothetical protein